MARRCSIHDAVQHLTISYDKVIDWSDKGRKQGAISDKLFNAWKVKTRWVPGIRYHHQTVAAFSLLPHLQGIYIDAEEESNANYDFEPDRMVQAIWTWFPGLRILKLNLPGIDTSALADVFKECIQLTDVELSGMVECETDSDELFELRTERMADHIICHPTLTNLSIFREPHHLERCFEPMQVIMERAAASSLKNGASMELQRLRMADCPLEDKALISFLSSSASGKLKLLELRLFPGDADECKWQDYAPDNSWAEECLKIRHASFRSNTNADLELSTFQPMIPMALFKVLGHRIRILEYAKIYEQLFEHETVVKAIQLGLLPNLVQLSLVDEGHLETEEMDEYQPALRQLIKEKYNDSFILRYKSLADYADSTGTELNWKGAAIEAMEWLDWSGNH